MRIRQLTPARAQQRLAVDQYRRAVSSVLEELLRAAIAAAAATTVAAAAATATAATAACVAHVEDMRGAHMSARGGRPSTPEESSTEQEMRAGVDMRDAASGAVGRA